MTTDGTSPQPAPLAVEICAFVAGTGAGDIPDPVIARGKAHILDALGLALAGTHAPASRIVRRHIAAAGATGPARILGTGLNVAPRFAALANGTAMHAENFDDTNPQADPGRNGGIHATAAVLPAALALAEATAADGRALIAAYHLGVEVACKLNHAVGQRHYAAGFHPTGTLNTFAAAAAAARLIGLDAGRIGHALGGAASLASGVRANFGTMVEQLHPGLAAEAGIVAADLAACGLTGTPAALDGPGGFLAAAGDGFDAAAICGRLGAPWAFAEPGMWIKPWPSGALTHPAMTLLAGMIRDHGIEAGAVAALEVRTNRRVAETLIRRRPETAAEARFSLPFCLAILLLEGDAGPARFTDATVNRRDVQEMIGRIEHTPYDEVEPGFTNVTTFVEVRLGDGTVHSGRADFARGSSAAPMTFDEVAEKFSACADHAGWPAARARAAVETVAALDELDDIRRLTALLTKNE